MLELLYSPITWAITFGTLIYLLYRYSTSTFNFFSDQNIPGPKPIPLVGNAWGMWKRNMPEWDSALMKKYGKFVGVFDGVVPNLYTTDVDLIKAVFVKDFDHFVDRRFVDFRVRIARKFLTILRGQEWKHVRTSVTPAFNTGKIKKMSSMIKECADGLVNKLKTIAEQDGKLQTKDELSAFTMDVIARCAFGMKIDSLGNKDDPFAKNAKVVFSPPLNKSPIVLLPFIIPAIIPLFGKMLFVTKEFVFFMDILENLVKERRQSKEKYNDFVESATEAISEYTKETADGRKVPMWENEEVDEIVIAQSTLFMLAGFDTTANTLTNTIFQLTLNPEIQEKLYEAIMEKMENFEDVNHEMVLDFPYLDHVIQETLRIMSPVPRIERECTKDFTYKNIFIKKDSIVTVPTYALHYDEEHYPDPTTFNPDRWSTGKISPYVWMPFGMGPRNCVGMRFAMEEMKLALALLVKQFRFVPVTETPDKIEFQDGFLGITQPLHPIVVGVELRV